MKRGNGFTLIELLAVIVILAIIALIATPIILNIVEKARKSAFQDSAYGIIEAAKLQYVEGILDGSNSATTYTFNGTDSNLHFSGSIPEGGQVIVDSEGNVGLAIYSNGWCAVKGTKESAVNVIKYEASTCIVPDAANDPVIKLVGDREVTLYIGDTYAEQEADAYTLAGTKLTYTITITKDGAVVENIDTSMVGEYTVTYTTQMSNNKTATITRTVKVEIKTYVVGEEVTFDPGDGVSTTWNVLADNGNTVTMMLNQNLGSSIEWYASAENNSYGPVTALEMLNSRTVTWLNVDPIRDYQYANQAYPYGYGGISIKNGIATTETISGTEVTISGTSRARLITGEEFSEIASDAEWTPSNFTGAKGPSWLSINLSSSDSSLTGYWTLTARNLEGDAAYVRYSSSLYSSSTNNATRYGIRPVIEIPKTAL